MVAESRQHPGHLLSRELLLIGRGDDQVDEPGFCCLVSAVDGFPSRLPRPGSRSAALAAADDSEPGSESASVEFEFELSWTKDLD